MKHLKLLFFLFFLVGSVLEAEDLTRLGGDLSTTLTGHNGLQVTAPNVSDTDKRLDQVFGFVTFHDKFARSEGLGPFFNNNSCGGCHKDNGKGKVRIPKKNNRQHAMIVKVSLPGLSDTGAPINVPKVGEQLQEKSSRARKRRFKVRLRWRSVRGKYDDGSRYKLRKPRLRYRIPKLRRRESVFSLRMSPVLVGMGLLEGIPEEAILSLSDPEDSNNDGISGKPNYVPNVRTGQFAIGRFGFRASHPTLEQQSAAAAFHDMGLTNALFNDTDEPSELVDSELNKITVYQALAGVPVARNQDSVEVQSGQSIFKDIGCSDCHVMTFVTEHDVHEELNGQTIHPFTDLLLHDMGPGLADDRAEYSASGSEWRTTPLWGIGFAETVNNVPLRYLHDGRARSIEEAILWHGGEAEASQQRFKALSEEQRDALIAFIRSL